MSAVEAEWVDGSARVRVLLDEHEARILAEVAAQLVALLREHPDDPAAAALFPRGYADDAEQAEFARYTRADLAERKAAVAERLAELWSGTSRDADALVVSLSVQEAWDWLTFCTDLRLVLADRLAGVEASDAGEQLAAQGLFDWLAYVQGSIVDVLAEIETGPDQHF